MSKQYAEAYHGNQFALTIVCAATLKYKLQIKIAITH